MTTSFEPFGDQRLLAGDGLTNRIVGGEGAELSLLGVEALAAEDDAKAGHDGD